jgi:pyruvate carboxylase subunit B
MVLPSVPFSPLPGGALTANTQMLRDNGLMDKFEQITAAMGEVVAKGGFGTSVTPVSQFYFQQAFNNVIYGPWQKIVDGYGKMVLGYFGKTPAKADDEVIKIASQQLKLEPTTQKCLEINDSNPQLSLNLIKDELAKRNIAVSDENIFIIASCEEKGYMFLEGKASVNVRKEIAKATSVPNDSNKDELDIAIGGKNYHIKLATGEATVNGKKYNFTLDSNKVATSTLVAKNNSDVSHEVQSPLPGIVLKINVKNEQQVNIGDTVLVLEAMKMENPIKAQVAGVLSLKVSQGQQIKVGEALFVIKEC